MNATAGREEVWGIGTLRPAEWRRHVVVLGGGPAGLEAARVAALRGHRVTLLEKADRLGGQVNDASLAPGRHEFGEIARYLSAEVARLGVIVRLREEASVDTVLKAAADAVVLATGAVPRPAPTLDSVPSMDAVTALKRLHDRELGSLKHVVVVDEIGQFQAYGIVEALISQGIKVDLITSRASIGWHVPAISLHALMGRLRRAKVQIYTAASLSTVDTGIRLRFQSRDEEIKLEGVNLVVYAMAAIPHNPLADDLFDRVTELHVIGDCAVPRGALEAIYEGHRVGRQV